MPERRMQLNCISTIRVCCYVGERDTQIFRSDDQGIVDREGFVVQVVHYVLQGVEQFRKPCFLVYP